MNDTGPEYDRLWKLIDDAQSETDHETANGLFRKAERLGRQLHDREPNDAEHCYAIALTYYHRWDSPIERRKCVEWLRKTEELNSAHPWVPLYLGYQFMDDNKYADAHAEFARVDQSYFASIEHHWRNIKTDELMLVALIREGASDIVATLLVSLADRYASADQIDQPIPTEIVKTLAIPEHRERFDVSSEQVAAQGCRLIRACGDDNVFPDELSALETAANTVG